MSKAKKKDNNVFFIGLLSFFGGISQDIFLPLLPIYLSTILGFSKEFIGFAEGLVTSSASIFRIVAGFLSDKFRKRKPIVFIGYFLSMISRPFLAIFASPFAVSALRFFDGVGKGVKDAPKDALIADSSVQATRGKSFGIARMLDTFGSVVGPLLLFLLLSVFKDSDQKFHYVFIISAIPLAITLLILIFKVKEKAVVTSVKKTELGFKLPIKFYIFLAIVVLFNLGNSSDTFIILRAQNVGIELLAIPLVYALFNFVYASASVPLGSLSDRIGREKVIVMGWLAYAFAYLGFALANQPYQIWLLYGFYGIYYATTEGVAKAMIADLVSSDSRGRAYGLYNAFVGLVTLPAGIIAGLLWEKVGSFAPFLFGSIMSAVATICLLLFINFKQKSNLTPMKFE